jgi:hypothetical protein
VHAFADERMESQPDGYVNPDSARLRWKGSLECRLSGKSGLSERAYQSRLAAWIEASGFMVEVVLMTSRIPRRLLLKATGASAIALSAGASSAACAAAAPVVPAVFNPAVDSWLADLGTQVAASLVTDAVKSGASKLWPSWRDAIKKRVTESTTGTWRWYGNNFWQHSGPPTVLFGVSTTDQWDPMTDGLVACVEGGKSAVVFQPWAWQALSMFVHQLTDKRTGDDLAAYQSLAVVSLIPSGQRPESGHSRNNSVGWMSYETRNGYVEIARLAEPDGSTTATVTASGIPDGKQLPRKLKFTLPAKSA